MLNKLREINERLIILYKTEPEKIKKQKLIKILLANNKCFFKIDMDTAISILKDLEIPDNKLLEVYSSLINSETYKEVVID